MRHPHLFKQMLKYFQAKQVKVGKPEEIHWWQLSLIGIGSIIGAGFFLGTGLSIKTAGPSILFAYVLGGIAAFIVFAALAEMTVHDPQKGSFRAYSEKAFGKQIGFISGWMYWFSGILIMSSEIIALSTFTQFWFPNFPLWSFSIIYATFGFGINLLGVNDFGKIESMFAVIKGSTLITFIIFGSLLALGLLNPQGVTITNGTNFTNFFPTGFRGMWSALIFVFFSFGGIAVVGVASTELKNKQEVPKAGIFLVATLLCIYMLSLFFVLNMVNWKDINEKVSPFVTALSAFQFPYFDSIFNIIVISAAFSTMVGALFSITNVLIALAHDGDAPLKLAEKNKHGVALNALILSAIALSVSIFTSYLLPNAVYEYFTTSAGIMLILNWLIILASQLKLHSSYDLTNKNTFKMPGFPYVSYLGIGLILFTITGALFHANERIGLFLSLGIVFLIGLSYKIFLNKK